VTILLRLLREVSYDGVPIAGARPADLLASLALQRAGASDDRLVEEVWGDEPPDVPAKALQVLVSRLRAQCGSSAIERLERGYRLTLGTDSVDAWHLERLLEGAVTALADDPACALALTSAASELVAGVAEPVGTGPLATLRQRARRLDGALGRTHGLALGRSGKDAEAVGALAAAHASDPDDVEVLEALLRSEAVAVGAPSALARYDAYRRDLADRLGVDPDPTLQRMHRELLAADEPIRSGVRYDADELLGREEDLAGLRALVRSGRLTTILGPGGLGKTRVAHVLAREATQPRVHFVELVGIASAADVASEVGSALGVRNSVTGRRTLTPAQQADVRGRIAQELDAAPTLLVLDNCEHVLDAVASLVAFLLVTTRDLRVVTTSRSPLGIAAERVFHLSQLAVADGSALFVRRARAARPEADLSPDVVADIVERLDGLPLAVELAAARIRTMSAEEVRRALSDRFALLRGRDRSAPARHQTLSAVIEWSWDLLSADEQRALAWLSVFHDGLGPESATSMLGNAGPDLVDGLVDQSLLTVVEIEGAVRYRMLETVREFGGHRLDRAGERADAWAAQTRWAVALCETWADDVFGQEQVTAIDHLWPEEGNLADVLRRTLTAGEAPSAVRLLATLGAVWSVTGNHPRIFAIADLAQRLFVDWEPPDDLAQVGADALSLLLIYTDFLGAGVDKVLVTALERLGVPSSPWTRAVYAMFVEADGSADRVDALIDLAGRSDRPTALACLQWASVLSENDGELELAASYVDQALELVDDDVTPWQVATLQTQKAYLALQRGDHATAAGIAELAVPVLLRLRAFDDALQAEVGVALACILDGDLDRAEKILRDVDAAPRSTVFGSAAIALGARAELQLARGDRGGALDLFERSVTVMRALQFPGAELTGLEPWVVLAESSTLTALVRYASTPTHLTRRDELGASLLRSVRLQLSTEGMLDYPVAGMALAGLGAHVLATDGDRETGVRLLALARCFGYNRTFPVMAWEPLRALAEAAAPARLDAVLDEYGDRRGRDLRAETADVLSRVSLTSSG